MPHFSTHTNRRGFTLIELIMVLALAAGIAVTMMSAAKSLNALPARGEVMKVAGAIRSAWERSALTGMRYDIVVNVGAGTLTLECSTDLSAARRKDEETARQRAFAHRNQDPFATNTDSRSSGRRARREDEVETDASPGMSACDDSVLRGVKLERGLVIERVQTARSKDPVTEGSVRIAVFPNGTIEPAILWVGSGSRKWTLFVHEMSGRVEIIAGEERRTNDFFELEEER